MSLSYCREKTHQYPQVKYPSISRLSTMDLDLPSDPSKPLTVPEPWRFSDGKAYMEGLAYKLCLWRSLNQTCLMIAISKNFSRLTFYPTSVCKSRRWEVYRARGSGLKLKDSKVRLDTKTKFFSVWVVRHWHRLPGEAVNITLLGEFKARLDGTLSSLV